MRSTWTRYGSKLIDAFQWTEHDLHGYPLWLKEAIIAERVYFLNLSTAAASMKIILASGNLSHAYFGDWIVHEPQGSIHAMKDVAFKRTYSEAPAEYVGDLL